MSNSAIMEQTKTPEAAVNEFIAAATAISKPSKLPELRSRLEKEMSDRPYQAMAIYQRNRHSGQGGEYWPDKPESMPAISRYPNILAELDASGWWIDRLARCAQVSMEIMAAAMEDNGELSWQELEGLKRGFKCKLDYLISPVLSMVDPSTIKGKARLWYLKDLERQTEGMDRFFYLNYSSEVLPALESGRPVTYAAYRWACINLQDVLDREEREAARKRRTRTGEISATENQMNIEADLSTRLRQARERAKVRAMMERMNAMVEYVDCAADEGIACDFLTAKYMHDLLEYSKSYLAWALILTTSYGYVRGYRAAKAEKGAGA